VAHQPHDLARLHLAHGAGQHLEVLAEGGDLQTADITGAGDDTIGGQFAPGHAKRHRVVVGVHAQFLKTARHKQGVDAFACRQ